jgi:hypothetical protein
VSSVPGRYKHNRDPQLAELLHHVTEQEWGNDSVGDLDQDGFHASLLVIQPAEQQELTEAFDRAILAGSWVITEDQHGFIIVDRPDASCGPVRLRSPARRRRSRGGGRHHHPGGALGSRYAVALAGSFLGYADDLERATAMLRAAMDADRYWPDAWFVSDQGNPTASTSGRRDQASGSAAGLAAGMAAVRGSVSGTTARIGEPPARFDAAVSPPISRQNRLGHATSPAHLRTPGQGETCRVLTRQRARLAPWSPSRRGRLDEGC